jgi:hypothetical protein
MAIREDRRLEAEELGTREARVLAACCELDGSGLGRFVRGV